MKRALKFAMLIASLPILLYFFMAVTMGKLTLDFVCFLGIGFFNAERKIWDWMNEP